MRKSKFSETQIVGILKDAESGVPVADLLDPSLRRRIAAEDAIDRIRGKFGKDSVGRGIGFGRKG